MTTALADLSNALANVVESVGPSIVRVEGRDRMHASGVLWSSEGVVLTAHHAVTRGEDIRVALGDGRLLDATLIGRDPSTDVAALRVNAEGLAPAAWAEPDGVRVGNLSLVLGRPGRNVMSTLGVVSALGDAWRTPAGGKVDRYIQSDAAMYPGFSGGALVGATGQALGIVTSGLLRGAGVVIPTPTLRRVVGALLAHGKVRRGYLGVAAQPVRLQASVTERLGRETGLMVVSVERDSPAERGGILIGDILIGYEGQPLRHMDDLLAFLSGDRVGHATTVTVVRGGEQRDVSVIVGERP